MPKSKSVSLLISIVLFVLSVVWLKVVTPEILKLQKDYSFTANIVSVDNFFNEEKGKYSGGVYSKTYYEYKTVSSTNDNSLIKHTFDVSTVDNTPIFKVERLYGIDRKTLKHTQGLGDKDRTGYLFAPRGLKPGQEFVYWHINYDGPATMKFVGVEYLYGLKVYKYETRYEGSRIDQTINLTYLPEVGKTRGVELEPYLQIWVEPVTGKLVEYKDDTIAYFYDLKTHERLNPWNQFSNTFDNQSVEKNATLINTERVKTITLEIYIPTLISIIALIFFANSFDTTKVVISGIKSKWELIAGIITIVVPIICLIGWIANIEWIKRPIPHTSAMNPMTCVCFILTGILILVTKYLPNKKIIILLSLILITIGSIRSAYILGFVSLEIDLIIFTKTIMESTAPARMAFFTALSFVLVGVANIATTQKFLKRIHIAEIAALTILLMSLLALMGFLFDIRSIVQVFLFVSAAIHTIILFLIVGWTIYKNNTSSINGKRDAAIILVLAFCLFFTVAIAGAAANVINNNARTRFSNETSQFTTDIKGRLEIYINALEGSRGLFAASEQVQRDEWQTYVTALNLQKNYPGLQGMGYTIFIKPEDKDLHVAEVQASGYPNYTIRPEGIRELYSSIIYIEPFDIRNQQAFGYDMYQEPTRRTAMEQARDTGRPTMSGSVTLVQEIDEDTQKGFLIYVPIYKTKTTHDTVYDRRSNIVGYVYSPFRARDFIESVITKEELENFGLIINDGTEMSESTLLYGNYNNTTISNNVFVEKRTLFIGGRPWTLTFISKEGFGETTTTKIIPVIILLIGISISVLLAMIFYVILSAQQQAIDYANKVTAELKENEQKLAKTNITITEKLAETEKLNKIMIDRELKMIELKNKIKELTNGK